MAYKYNKRKGKRYDPGTYTSFSCEEYKKTMKDKKKEVDRKIRQMVIETIESKIENAELEDIVHEIALHPLISRHFKYLEDAGMNLEETFTNWYKSYIANKGKVDIFEGREHGWTI